MWVFLEPLWRDLITLHNSAKGFILFLWQQRSPWSHTIIYPTTEENDGFCYKFIPIVKETRIRSAKLQSQLLRASSELPLFWAVGLWKSPARSFAVPRNAPWHPPGLCSTPCHVNNSQIYQEICGFSQSSGTSCCSSSEARHPNYRN